MSILLVGALFALTVALNGFHLRRDCESHDCENCPFPNCAPEDFPLMWDKEKSKRPR